MWFANNKQNEIIKIYDISEDEKHDEYRCPICSGLLRPRQGEIKQWHFSHMNAEDCSTEAFTHFWMKHELLKKGEPFKIKINGEIKEYICKDTLIEHEYNTSNGIYKPDLTIITENGEEIYFEIANTNKKKAKDYLNLWKELNNTVVEVAIKEMAGENRIDIFNAIYWDGKIFREQVKELKDFVDIEAKKNKYDEKKIEKIYWLINDICKYNNDELDIDVISDEIQAVEDEETRKLVVELLRRKCSNVMDDYIEYNKKKSKNILHEKFDKLKIYTENCRLVYDRIYYGHKIKIYYDNVLVNESETNYNNDDFLDNEILLFKKYEKIKEYVKNKYDNKYNSLIYKKENYYNSSYYFSIIDNKFELEKEYDECIKFIHKEILDFEKKQVELNNFNSNIDYIINKLYKNFKSITNISLTCNNSNMRIDFEYYKDIKCNYDICTHNKSEYDYYENKIEKEIIKDYPNKLSKVIEKYTKIYCYSTKDTEHIYLQHNGNSIPISIFFDKTFKINNEYIDNIKNIYSERIENVEKYIKLLEEYYLKCENTENNYKIILLNSDIDIYYKNELIKRIQCFQINNIQEIINDPTLLKSITEDVKDYNDYNLLKNITNHINELYDSKVYGYWNIKELNNQIYLYYKDNFKHIININDVHVDDLNFYLRNEISNYIRNYLYD